MPLEEMPLVKRSTKDSIIDVLSREHPLTARKIYMKLTKTYNISVSYQAVHKTLKGMLSQKVIEKDWKGYKLSKAWINNLNELGQKLKDEYDGTKIFKETKKMYKMSFRTVMDFILFHLDFLEKFVEYNKSPAITVFCRHVIYPLAFSGNNYVKFKNILRKSRWKIASSGSSSLDKWLAGYWEKWGAEVELGKDIPTDSIIFIHDDYIMQVHFSTDSKKEWDRIARIKDMQQVDINLLTEALHNPKNKTMVTLFKDKELAEELRKAAE